MGPKVHSHSQELKLTMKVNVHEKPRIINNPAPDLLGLMVAIGAKNVLLQMEWKFRVTDCDENVLLLPLFQDVRVLSIVIND